MRRAKKVLDVLTHAGCGPVALSEQDVATWQQRWRTVFANGLHVATGEWVLHDFDWHVFSYNHHPSRTGDAARNEYRRRAWGSFAVLSADNRAAFGFHCEGKPPDRLSGVDVIVAPPSLAWTMAFTHEEPVWGPYFAER